MSGNVVNYKYVDIQIPGIEGEFRISYKMVLYLLDIDLYRGSKSMPAQKGVRTHPAYSEAAQRQLASLTQMSAKVHMRYTKEIKLKLSATIKA